MIGETINLLHVERIDHGIRAIENHALIEQLKQKKIALTVCPLSNLALGIVKNLQQHPLKQLLDAGLMVTINSDDPAFFKGYIAENYYDAVTKMGLSVQDIIQCAHNSFQASFASEKRKKECLEELSSFLINFPNNLLVHLK
jgi:adenosine deaminase